MDENLYYKSNKNKFDEISNNLSILVEDLKSYEKNFSKTKKSKILEDLKKVSHLCKILDGILEKDFLVLKDMIINFLNDPKNLNKIMIKCVEFKNQLWEL